MRSSRRDGSLLRRAARSRPLVAERLEERLAPAVGPTLVSDPQPATAFGLAGGEVTDVGGVGYFACGRNRPNSIPDVELCRTDGTRAGTQWVKDIAPGGASSNPSDLVNVNGKLFFVANKFLWRSDGTSSGTVMVKQINVAANTLTNVNGTLYFSANDPPRHLGYELWKSDGTTNGTVLVKDIRPGPGGAAAANEVVELNSSHPSQLMNIGGTLYFVANDGTNGAELWKSNGTAGGTRIVKDIAPGAAGSAIGELANLNGKLVFRANDGASGNQLWRSDGTAGGTAVVKNDFGPATGPRFLTEVNGKVLFTANDGTSGYELWKTDGTAAGTTLVKEIAAGGASANPTNLVKVDGKVFFYVRGEEVFELWKTDGTSGGTALVAELAPVSSGRAPGPGHALGGMLFFPFNDGTHGSELWKSDGTAAGTVLVKDYVAGPEGSAPDTFSTLGLTLFYNVSPLPSVRELTALHLVPAALVTRSAAPPGVRRVRDVLEVGGTNANDQIFIRLAGERILVEGTLGQQAVRVTFSQATIRRMTINLEGGDDWLRIARGVQLPAQIHAGDGNDAVAAGGGSASIIGGAGNDFLVGSAQHDVLVGGAGDDTIAGGKGNDLLIGGRTIYDDNQHVMRGIWLEWSSPRAVERRISNLHSAAGPLLPYLGIRLVTGATVLSDGNVDQLFGGQQADWFMDELGGSPDRQPSELYEELY